MLVIGRNPVIEALKFNPKSIKKLVLLESVSNNKLKEIIKIAQQKNIIIEKFPKIRFEKLLDRKDKSEGISQGIIAEVEEFKYSKTSEILKSVEGNEQITLAVLDEIQDPHNFGAIIRSAAASGIVGIIISDKNTVKVNHTVIKTSSGATNYIKISKESNIYTAVEYLKEKGFKIIGTVLNADKNLYEFSFPGKCVIIFGNEGEGLRKNLIKLCDYLIKIPLAGKIESLNVSVTAGVIFYEILRQRNY
ncbi:MAG: 23S rRNA (guanosine(2251)-2'-O)-methyltransferase RlmB [Chlorobi bacterium]|nr:23S rRNA (guanosine(2251)-2'-O)-methyltransferase RlmB [Chlorobiota bacterium]MCI0715841.1 23S rRNA (guanosine(2251)-2'-O)-methyltransferase RlmB [Chlorobiota bacterium]